MAYYTNVGPLSGPLLASAGYYAIGVLQAPQCHTPIGTALAAGKDANGLALWRLTIDQMELTGLYVAIDREFRPTGSTVGNVHGSKPAARPDVEAPPRGVDARRRGAPAATPNDAGLRSSLGDVSRHAGGLPWPIALTIGPAAPCAPTPPTKGRSIPQIDVDVGRLGAEPDVPLDHPHIAGASPPARSDSPPRGRRAPRSRRRPCDPPGRSLFFDPYRAGDGTPAGVGPPARVLRRRIRRGVGAEQYDIDPVSPPGRWIAPPAAVALEVPVLVDRGDRGPAVLRVLRGEDDRAAGQGTTVEGDRTLHRPGRHGPRARDRHDDRQRRCRDHRQPRPEAPRSSWLDPRDKGREG